MLYFQWKWHDLTDLVSRNHRDINLLKICQMSECQITPVQNNDALSQNQMRCFQFISIYHLSKHNEYDLAKYYLTVQHVTRFLEMFNCIFWLNRFMPCVCPFGYLPSALEEVQSILELIELVITVYISASPWVNDSRRWTLVLNILPGWCYFSGSVGSIYIKCFHFQIQITCWVTRKCLF